MIQDTSSQDVVTQKPKFGHLRIKLGIFVSIIMALSIFAYPGISNWISADISIEQSRVRTALVMRGDFINDISLQGNIIAANSPRLYASAAGTVSVKSNPGNKVNKGALVAVIDSPELTNRLQQEQARLESLGIELERQKIAAKQARIKSRQQVQLEKVVLDAAKREMRRAKQSVKIKAISQLDYEKAMDELKRSQLKYDFAKEQSELEKENLAFEIKTREFELNQYRFVVNNTRRLVNELNIIAPVSGIVGSWSVEQKSTVLPNQPLLTIVDLSAFQVEIDIPEAYVDELGIGMLAKVTYNGVDYDASIVTISPEVENNIVKGRIAFKEKTPPGIKQNQRVSSRILVERKKDILYLPRGSFVQQHAGRQAFVIDNGIATLTNISLGASSIDKVEVVSGLRQGQEVIISNTEFVRDAKVLVLN